MAAAKTLAKEKPPSYEISPKWFLTYLAVYIVFGTAASAFSYVFKSLIPIFIYFGASISLLYVLFFEYLDARVSRDISSEIYHPDLLSQKEFRRLRRRYQELNALKYFQAYRPKYQQEYDDLMQIIGSQMELRTVCWFKMLFGVPVDAENAAKEKIIKKCASQKSSVENVIDEAATESKSDVESDAEFEYDFSTSEEDESESDSEVDSSDSDDTDVPKKGRKNTTEITVIDLKNELENVKARITQIETENVKLKNFIENFIESQTIV